MLTRLVAILALVAQPLLVTVSLAASCTDAQELPTCRTDMDCTCCCGPPAARPGRGVAGGCECRADQPSAPTRPNPPATPRSDTLIALHLLPAAAPIAAAQTTGPFVVTGEQGSRSQTNTEKLAILCVWRT